jgi:hypothetical protein
LLDAGALCGLASYRGNAQEFAVRVAEEMGQADGIIDVGTDVSIEQDFCHE